MFQASAFQVNAFQVLGEAAVAPVVQSSGGGRVRFSAAIVYRAKYRGEVFEFTSFEELEAFVLQTQRNEQAKPKRKRQAVKIELPPETVEDLAPYDLADKPVLPKIDLRQATESLAQIRRLIERKKREIEEEEEVLLWLL